MTGSMGAEFRGKIICGATYIPKTIKKHLYNNMQKVSSHDALEADAIRHIP